MKEARGNDLYVGEGIRSAAPDPFISLSTVPSPSHGRKGWSRSVGVLLRGDGTPPVLTGLLGLTGSEPYPSSVPEGRWN